jgi:hypothetical protein
MVKDCIYVNDVLQVSRTRFSLKTETVTIVEVAVSQCGRPVRRREVSST